jgi:alpha-L-rhamnosidase
MGDVIRLTCEYRTNPLGIDVKTPRFAWQLLTERRGARQTAFRLLAATDTTVLEQDEGDLWDSGRLESDQSVHIAYAGKALNSRQRVYWKVLVWDDTGAVTESDTAWFEMGLLQREGWSATWIEGNLTGGARSTIPVPFLRKPFYLPGQVASARLYATALGVYECSLNGETTGDNVFTPGWTDYRKRIQYQVYDVAHLLHEGENVLGSILGDGWAVGFIGLGNRQFYADRPALLAQLEITLADGQQLTIVSDGSWKHQYGPVLESDMFMGEAYDARLEMPDWNRPGFDDQEWLEVVERGDPGALLVATSGPTVKRIQELTPISEPVVKGDLIHKRAILDMGQNMVGRVRFKGTAPAGTTVVLRFAEVLKSNGYLYTDNLRDARATDVYTFKGDGEEVWEPSFTFHGFRYVEVKGYPGEVTRDTITGIVLHSAMDQTGDFESSNALFNQLQHNILWGQKGNFLDVPTDCPQRDERLGWTGDIQVFARTAAFNMDIAGFMTKWAQDVTDAQSESGAVPPVVPSVMPGFTDGGPAWADAVIICPWTIYLCYRDRRIIEEQYDTMTRFMRFVLETSPNYIRCAPEYEGWRGFGDWLSINAETPRDLIGTAFLAYDAKLMAQIAEVLGRSEDAERYRTLFSEVKDAFGRRFLKGSRPAVIAEPAFRADIDHADAVSRGNAPVVDSGPVTSEVFNTDLFTPQQTAYVLALHFDLLPESLRPLAVAELGADIKRRDMHLSTGFVGAPYLPQVLSDNGELETAYALLHQTTWPSWLYSVTKGATTIWERWDGWTEERGFQDPGMNSFNHYAYGSIGAWLYQTVAGIEIDPANPGYKHTYIRPQPGGGLTSARASLQTVYGLLESNWRLEDNVLHLEVTVPVNTTATVTLPNAQVESITENGQMLEQSPGISHIKQKEDAVSFEVVAGRYAFRCMRL